ncbi:MAG: response regulator, partial [Candidatus Omnitrophica bacterium]|nr:response regulator [Candidatus Omnitrophota bacterium]
MFIPLRVLMIGDNENDVKLLRKEMERGGYKPLHKRVDTFDSLKEALNQGVWDIIVTDYHLGKCDIFEVLRYIKGQDLSIPV